MTSKLIAGIRIVSCPRCGTGVVWSHLSPYRPFCSERCRMVDLGRWADESYRIPLADDGERADVDGDAERA